MEEIGPKKLNWVKVIIIIFVVLIIIGLAIFFFVSKNNPTNPITQVITTKLFVDKTNSISFKLSKKYNLSVFNSDSNHILELHSPDELYVLVSFQPLFAGHSVTEIIESDRDYNIKDFESAENISDVKNESINNLNVYSYSFDYTSDNKECVLKTVWIENEFGYYIVDINYLKNKAENYESLYYDILNSFEFIEKESSDENNV